jgi:4-diphosphocytidyl-2-C-methyl-D-erythritol kinase
MIVFPNAKINLGLHIVSKRPDGYHNIETVFYPVRLHDALEIVPSENDKTTFVMTGIAVAGNPDDNLVMRAFHILKKDFALPEITIYLRKNIPFGAGLGGGSSDAAWMLKLLNDFAELHLSDQQLEEYAGRLGADCPFFIKNTPVFAGGIGNIFEPVEISLASYQLLLVKPDIGVSTQEAYANVKPQKPLFSIKETLNKPIEEWKNCLFNDFEPGVFARYPEIGKIKQQLYDNGAIYASMSGSGSSVYGIFDSKKILDYALSNSYVLGNLTIFM